MSTIINKNDSMSKIQSKINNKGTIIFTKGTYKITKQLIIPSNTVLDLNGSTIQRKGSLQSIFLNKVSSSTKGYKADGNITIKNGIIEGMGGYSYDNLVTFFHSHDITITNCEFRDALCHAIEINSCENVEIKNCKFLGYNMKNVDEAYKECIQLDHAGFSGFVLSGSSKSSSCYDGTCCHKIYIHDCLFSKSNYRDYPYACIGEHSQIYGSTNKHSEIKIYNNKFYCKKNPDLKQACLSITCMKNVDIFDNYFDCYRVARIYSKNYSYTIKGSKVTAKNGDGICDSINITNNKISGCTNNKEAFQQYNKSGDINHTNIKKTGNIYV